MENNLNFENIDKSNCRKQLEYFNSIQLMRDYFMSWYLAENISSTLNIYDFQNNNEKLEYEYFFNCLDEKFNNKGISNNRADFFQINENEITAKWRKHISINLKNATFSNIIELKKFLISFEEKCKNIIMKEGIGNLISSIYKILSFFEKKEALFNKMMIDNEFSEIKKMEHINFELFQKIIKNIKNNTTKLTINILEYLEYCLIINNCRIKRSIDIINNEAYSMVPYKKGE